MQREQRIIAAWLRFCLEHFRIEPTTWAAKAKLHPTTVSRALKDDYTSVTSIKTLRALAEALEIPSVLDFISFQMHELSEPSIAARTAKALLRKMDEDRSDELFDSAFITVFTTLLAASPDLRRNNTFLDGLVASALSNATR